MNPAATLSMPATVITGSIAAHDTPANPIARRRQRHEPRREFRVPCRVRLVNPATGEVRSVAGETLNLSPRGMALQVTVDVPVGTWVETLVNNASGEAVFLSGKVAHCRRVLATSFEIGVVRDALRTFL